MCRVHGSGAIDANRGAVLAGTTGSGRAASIGEMARFLGGPFTGAKAAVILGARGQLAETDRYRGIESLARNAKLALESDGRSTVPLLDGTTGSARAAAIAAIAKFFGNPLTGASAALVLGTQNELAEADRYPAIEALARARQLV